MKDTVIKINNLTKTYKLYDKPFDRVKEAFDFSHKDYSKEKSVLNDVNIEINRGEVVGIVGTNGAGKSTLLKIVTGVLTPTSGNIEINGKIAALLELGTGFNPEFTGIKNIFFTKCRYMFFHRSIYNSIFIHISVLRGIWCVSIWRTFAWNNRRFRVFERFV